ncbi:Uncharacterized protein GBIM_14277 [Gryllus bimaculatus]|nr:Uncharacterized protein GBIM_14277 [Gryllus bimaculatus]
MVDNPLGENVFSFVSSDAHTRQRVGVRNALDAWYAEGRLFDYGNEPLDTKARNFTQMMWRSTRLLGLAVARGRGGRVIVVANYYPRGNIVGQYRDNVPPPFADPAAAAATAAVSAAVSAATDAAADDDDEDDDDSSYT